MSTKNRIKALAKRTQPRRTWRDFIENGVRTPQEAQAWQAFLSETDSSEINDQAENLSDQASEQSGGQSNERKK
ncbi:MAG: hypothetical protein HYZ25_19200 [Chloroflexi bacterium]|nr:hypothetical protein [Chloroflexota bacterium]